jgi:hypothetical protein
VAISVEIEKDELRERTLQIARQHKASWIELGQHLYTIQKDKLFRFWGYLTFEVYCRKELGLKDATAGKMVRSYSFLEREEPTYVKSEYSGDANPRKIPNFESVNMLRLAKRNKHLTEKDVSDIRDMVLESAKEPKEVRAQVKQLVSERNPEDPAEVRKNRRNATIRRVISILNNTKTELENGGLLPNYLLTQMEELREKLEDQLE